MKITHNKVGQNLNIQETGAPQKSKKSQGIQKEDKTSASSSKKAISQDVDQSSKVEVSSRAQDMRKAKEIALSTPDINEEKIKKIQKLIDEGNYKVNSEAVADKLIEEELKWS